MSNITLIFVINSKNKKMFNSYMITTTGCSEVCDIFGQPVVRSNKIQQILVIHDSFCFWMVTHLMHITSMNCYLSEVQWIIDHQYLIRIMAPNRLTKNSTNLWTPCRRERRGCIRSLGIILSQPRLLVIRYDRHENIWKILSRSLKFT